MIIRSTHKFAPGHASTSIEAKWVNQIDYEEGERIAANDTQQQSEAGQQDRNRLTCRTERNRASNAAADSTSTTGGWSNQW